MSDINYYNLGNGLTVCDKDRPEEHGDYCKIAHIRADRSIKYYKPDITHEDKRAIRSMARTHDGGITKIWRTPGFQLYVCPNTSRRA